jgi:Fic family protein
MTTNAELIAALRCFWPDTDQEAEAFLGALAECAEEIINAADMRIDPDHWAQFAELLEVLDTSPAGESPSPRSRLLEAAGQGGVTISSAARLLGVSRWRARQLLGELRDEGALQVHSQGRASRWLPPGTGSAA